jgi:hypothetical protein
MENMQSNEGGTGQAEQQAADIQTKIDDLKAKADSTEGEEKNGIMAEIGKLNDQKKGIMDQIGKYETDAKNVIGDVGSIGKDLHL